MAEIVSNIEDNQDLEKTKTDSLDVNKLLRDIDTKLSNKDLSDLAKTELEEFKAKLELVSSKYKKERESLLTGLNEGKEGIMESTSDSYMTQDLYDEFKDDLEALDIIEEKYKDYYGYDEFISLLKSNELSETQKEKIFFLFGSNNSIFIQSLDEELPTDKESIKNILLDNKDIIKDNINKEVNEVIKNKKDLTELSLGELTYRREKLKSLLRDSSKDKEEINSMLIDIGLIINIKKGIKENKNKENKEQNEKEENKNKKNKEQNEKEEKITEKEEKIKEIEKQIPKLLSKEFIQNDKEFYKLLQEFVENSGKPEIQIEKSKEISNYLSRPGNLNRLLELAKKSGGKDYEEFHSFATGIADVSGNTALKDLISSYPSSNSPVPIPDPQKFELEQYFSGDTSDIIVDGEKYFLNDEVVDYSEEPPLHFILNKDTGYKLEVENSKSSEIARKALEARKIYNEMYSLKENEINLKNENKVLASLLKDENKLGEIAKNQGKEISDLKIEIERRISDNNKEINKSILAYKDLKERYILLTEDSDFEEGKDKQREILKFLHATGFDLIPQEKTDQLINEMKDNDIIIPGLVLDPKRINIREGNFGEAEYQENSTKFKENLIDFMNKLVYGELQPDKSPLNKKSFLDNSESNVDLQDFKSKMIQRGLFGSSGFDFDIEKARINLENDEFKDKPSADPDEMYL